MISFKIQDMTQHRHQLNLLRKNICGCWILVKK